MGAVNRRGFLQALIGSAAALTLDPERLLWVPGAKTISIPPPVVVNDFSAFFFEVMLPALNRKIWENYRRKTNLFATSPVSSDRLFINLPELAEGPRGVEHLPVALPPSRLLQGFDRQEIPDRRRHFDLERLPDRG